MENMDMNYDLNDGIPPYDLPYEGGSNDGSDNFGASDSPAQNSVNPPYDVENAAPSVEVENNEYEFETEDVSSSDEAPSDINYEEASKTDKNHSKVVLPIVILILVLFLGGALYLIYGSDFNFSNITANNENAQTEEVATEEAATNTPVAAEETDDINKILSESSETIDVEMLRNRHNMAIQNKMSEDAMVNVNNTNGLPQDENEKLATLTTSVPRGNIGRLDPFNPNGGSSQLFDVLLPPSNPTPDTEAQQLMTLKISGIMYTPDSPSALINIAGSDQLVRKGDKFNGFSVEGISKDKVTVRNGKNTYTASVGESLSVDSVGVNAIPNLNNKFAGPYSKGSGKIIEINTLN